jgi:protein-tyrosine-phosphatase/predicted ATP-grasp superfamily ATP-dependent carboligase
VAFPDTGKPLAATTTPKRARILVLDADLVPALTIVRSLVRQHYHVEVASARDAPIASFSRGMVECHRYPDPLSGEEHFLLWLEAHLAASPCDLIIPVTERTLVPLSANRQRFRNTRLAMAAEDSLNRVLDKAETFKLAQSLGVAIPRSIYLSNISQLAESVADLTYPVVVKPSHSVAAGDAGYSKRNVSYANNETELRSQCEQCLRHSPVILQGYFQGLGAGIELIAREGEIIYPFQHIRLHEVPLTGGGSSFRVSAAIEPVLLQAAEKLIRALRWTGVAMVEFKWEPVSGKCCLMEINGRFWGSLPLAVAAGADFPAMQAELSLTGALGEYPPYRQGVYCRNLASDLMWHELVLRSRGKGNSQRSNKTQIPTARVVLRDLARLFSPRHYFDTQSFRDPLPGLVEIKRLLGNYGGRLSGVIAGRWFARHQRLLWRDGTVHKSMRTAKTVLFICYGNINRSALAEIIMASLLPADCDKKVLSAGFHHEEARPADARMQKIGAESGFDLSRCRSTRITRELINDSDIIFVMEKKHYDDLLSDYSRAEKKQIAKKQIAKKTFLLGPGSREAGRGATEIPDPYNQSEDTYRACFAQIHQAVACLNEGLKTDHAR